MTFVYLAVAKRIAKAKVSLTPACSKTRAADRYINVTLDPGGWDDRDAETGASAGPDEAAATFAERHFVAHLTLKRIKV